MPLSTEDQLEIQSLYSRCAICFDLGDAAGFADAFTPDGSFTSGGGDPIVGREALSAYVSRRFEEAPGMSHHICNVLIEESANGARGRAYGVIIGRAADDRLQLRSAGTYEDEIVRDDGRWRIMARRFTPRLAAGQVGLYLTAPAG